MGTRAVEIDRRVQAELLHALRKRPIFRANLSLDRVFARTSFVERARLPVAGRDEQPDVLESWRQVVGVVLFPDVNMPVGITPQRKRILPFRLDQAEIALRLIAG